MVKGRPSRRKRRGKLEKAKCVCVKREFCCNLQVKFSLFWQLIYKWTTWTMNIRSDKTSSKYSMHCTVLCLFQFQYFQSKQLEFYQMITEVIQMRLKQW